MAKLYPSLEIIEKRNPKPTEGEMTLLLFLLNTYNDEYEIFFQPFLNGDLPDIVLVHKGGGVMIFEVKDWNLSDYEVNYKGDWRVKWTGQKLGKSTPLNQVLKYKKNLYDLHIDSLLSLHLKDYKYWYIVNCAIYFHCCSTERATELCLGKGLCKQCWNHKLEKGKCCESNIDFTKIVPIEECNNNRDVISFLEKCRKYRNYFRKNFTILGCDSLNKDYFDQIFYSRWISRTSRYFTTELYKSFIRRLQPSYHTIEEGMKIELTKEQIELSESKEGERKRIKGVAGSGKTLVLAQRAVNAHKRTNGYILILTYNITLRNYIHDQISAVREKFSWEYFHISNYHDFITSNMNNVGIHFDFLESDEEGNFVFMQDKKRFNQLSDEKIYSNLHLFDNYKDKLPKYNVILIDETQDYKENWIRIIKDNFATENAEIVVFADEKQNIYSRELDEIKMPKIPIQVGQWDKKLNKSYRLSRKIALLISDFQKKYFSQKYDIENQIETNEMLHLFEEPYIEYHYITTSNGEKEDKELAKYIYAQILEHKLHSNDVTILSSRIRMLRSLDYMLRIQSKEKTNTMFETREEFLELFPNAKTGLESNSEIEKLRKNKKANFWMNRGTIKLSTIHSFKGWESPTVFLVIENNVKSQSVLNGKLQPEEFADELIYTGMTRCRNSLFIINRGNKLYHDFFSKSILVDKVIINKMD